MQGVIDLVQLFQFLSTPSARRATLAHAEDKANRMYFYPRPPRGGRPYCSCGWAGFAGISIHALREEGDCANLTNEDKKSNFYPRPPRGGRLRYTKKGGQKHGISIHALREEGDVGNFFCGHAINPFLSTPSARRATEYIRQPDENVYISIHALREEGDITWATDWRHSTIFLSTPSARRATSQKSTGSIGTENFYPRPPRGGRLDRPLSGTARPDISIHALREEGDHRHAEGHRQPAHFYPRPPRGGRPRRGRQGAPVPPISIHALREEGDLAQEVTAVYNIKFLSTPSARRATYAAQACGPEHRDFYPRPPRGGRHETFARMCNVMQFLSTPSARRATHPASDKVRCFVISIHALREEGDGCSRSDLLHL